MILFLLNKDWNNFSLILTLYFPIPYPNVHNVLIYHIYVLTPGVIVLIYISRITLFTDLWPRLLIHDSPNRVTLSYLTSFGTIK